MARPDKYRTADGTEVPSVTTIIRACKSSEGLVYWAWREGCEGRDYRKTRDDAAGVGTIVHARAEAYLALESLDAAQFDPALWDRSHRAFYSFLSWAADRSLGRLSLEASLVSEVHRFGGTMDLVALDGVRTVTDWKTAKAIYPEVWTQLAAYALLWDEYHPGAPIKALQVVRFGREDGAIEDRTIRVDDPAIVAAKMEFVLLARAYEARKFKERALKEKDESRDTRAALGSQRGYEDPRIPCHPYDRWMES